ncbi:MAG: Gfo/Idh/MocA family oxidoreductase [Phycisphaerae bacterium]|nr:Gfo/Idh/MocA family oxidoreductase [Phycisphaerae bacterium]
MLRKHTTCRRTFLKNLAATGAVISLPAYIPSQALGKNGTVAPSERVTLGCIGVGGRGMLDTNGLLRTNAGQVVAVCDVNAQRRKRAQSTVNSYYAKTRPKSDYKGCDAYNDFRKVILRNDIDAVMVATPDHWHVPIAMAAVRSGKDIYVEKPLAISIGESRALKDIVQRYSAVFQHGTEQRAMAHLRYACELVRNGRIGRLHTVSVGAPGGRAARPVQPTSAPDHLDYDFWLGPAPKVPFTPGPCLGNGHWFISDYAASGFVAGWGIHPMDIAHWAMDADRTGPLEIEGVGVYATEGPHDTPLKWNVSMRYADDVKVRFIDSSQWKLGAEGIRFEGSDGWIFASRFKGLDAGDKSLLKSVIGPNEIHLYEASNDDRNFVECVRSRGETVSPIHAAHSSTTVCLLSNIAMILGRKLKWDPGTERFTNDDEANQMLSRAHRAPWNI